MKCEQARQLFDAYLDGELSGSLATEFGAHRLRCAECRQSLALLEVSGHIISSDADPVELDVGFTDRLLACVDSRERTWIARVRRALYIAGPLAAAAVIALAFLGAFDRSGEGVVAGTKEYWKVDPAVIESEDWLSQSKDAQPDLGADLGETGQRLDQILREADRRLKKVGKSKDSLEKRGEMTIFQLLAILEQQKTPNSGEDHFPGAEAKSPPIPSPDVSTDNDDAEDE